MASRLASRLFNTKRRLENYFARDLRRIYRNETDYVYGLLNKGLMPDKFDNSVELQSAINKHLKRIRKQLNNSAFVDRAINVYNEFMSESIYNDCVGSFNKLSNSISKKEQKLSLSVGKKKIETFAKVNLESIPNWSALMYGAIPARTAIISNVETQEPFEGGRMIESLESEAIEPEIAGSSVAVGILAGLSLINKKKTWRSILNQDTRDWHASADGQTVKISEPFIVNGQKMMYPGDSRNASPSNYMNCHCSVQYN